MCGEADKKKLLLKIPDLEILEIFVTQIREWFRQMVCQDQPQIDSFCRAFRLGDAKAVEEQLEAYLKRTISIRDTGIVIETKYAKDGNLDAGCQAALEQIREKGYEEKLRAEGMKKILDFRIAFF